MKKFDLVTALIALAGKIQAKRVARLKAREAALTAAIGAASKALVATQRERIEAQNRKVGE